MKEKIYITPECLASGMETASILCQSTRETQTSEIFEEYSPEW